MLHQQKSFFSFNRFFKNFSFNPLLIFFVFYFATSVRSQTVYFQDVFNGEISSVGLATDDAHGQITLPTNLSNGTTTRKVFLICNGVKGSSFIPNFRRFAIDSVELQLDSLNPCSILVGNNTTVPLGNDYNGHVTYIKDLTPYINSINDSVTINWMPNDFFNPTECFACNISAPMLLILSENNNLPAVNVALVINEQNNDHQVVVNTDNLNSADFNYPIAMGIHCDRVGGNPNDGYSFKINNQNAGEIRTFDNSTFTFGSGAVGCFHYANHALTALTDDNVDSVFSGPFSISGYADGLATINGYLNHQLSPLQLNVDYTDLYEHYHNIFIGYTLAYSTPCQPQNVITSSDTVICKGETLALHAHGGNSYKWRPQQHLSCYDCPAPIFTGDSSQLYTVQISSNDSCSVIRPIMVQVKQMPPISSLHIQPSLCGASTGSVQLLPASPTSITMFALDNGAQQNTGYFSQLTPNSHTITVVDQTGCAFDTAFTIPSYKTVIADFQISSLSGIAPQQFTVTDISSDADGVLWKVNGENQINPFNSFSADSAGMYTIELIAWQNDSICSDTASKSVLVSAIPFYIYGSSLILHSLDQQSNFMVQTNGNPIVSIELFDLNGRLIKQKNNLSLSPGNNSIWNQNEMNQIQSEMCLYRIKWKTNQDAGEYNGKVTLIR